MPEAAHFHQHKKCRRDCKQNKGCLPHKAGTNEYRDQRDKSNFNKRNQNICQPIVVKRAAFKVGVHNAQQGNSHGYIASGPAPHEDGTLKPVVVEGTGADNPQEEAAECKAEENQQQQRDRILNDGLNSNGSDSKYDHVVCNAAADAPMTSLST